MRLLLALSSLLLPVAGLPGELSGACRRWEADYGWVCVCDAGGCDALPDSQPPPSTINVFTTSQKGGPFVQSSVKWQPAAKGKEVTLVVDPRMQMQDIQGFGGAFTDAAGINIVRLPPALQDDLVASYFHPTEGSRYSIGRIPIASCDFSTYEYSYDDSPGDLTLANFSLAPEDFKYKIPFLAKAKALAGDSLRLFGSPWSAPAWMKTNGKMNGKGALLGQPGGQYYKTWANYIVKFLDAYAKHNLTIWAVTVQNEPSTGFLPNYAFQTMAMSATTERDYVKMDLGPAIANSAYNNTAIIILDDQRIYVAEFTDKVLGDTEAAKYVAGVGLHWYMDGETPAAFIDAAHSAHPNVFFLSTEACAGSLPWEKRELMRSVPFPPISLFIDAAHSAHPNVFFLSTEACAGSLPWEKRGVTLGNWRRAVEYAGDVMEDLTHWVGGWVDWNLALNSTGGPNWVNNIVDSPIIVPDTPDKFYKQPMFYALAHFSAFLPPRSRRVNQKVGAAYFLDSVSLLTPTKDRVVLLLNKGPWKAIKVRVSEVGSSVDAVVSLPPQSITTLHWRKM